MHVKHLILTKKGPGFREAANLTRYIFWIQIIFGRYEDIELYLVEGGARSFGKNYNVVARFIN